MNILKPYLASLFLICSVAMLGQTAENYKFTPEPISKHYSDIPFSELTFSGGISTMGLTAEIATPLSLKFQLRGGLNFFYYKSKSYENNLSDPHGYLRSAFGYKPDMVMSGKLNTLHTHALIDFYPVKGGMFFISSGFYVGQNKLKLNGYLQNKEGERAVLKEGQDWPTLDFQGNIITTNNGDVNIDGIIGNTIKPYVGVGLGKTVTKKKLGFTIELGIMYQGDYRLKQNGAEITYNFDENVEYNKETEKWLNRIKWWPKASIQLRYRLF